MHSGTTTIEKIIRERLGGKSLYRLALELGVSPVYLYDVVKGRRVSRRLVLAIAEHLHFPDLLREYEKELITRSVGKQSKKSTSNKGGSKHE